MSTFRVFFWLSLADKTRWPQITNRVQKINNEPCHKGDVLDTGPETTASMHVWPAIPETSPNVLITVIQFRSKYIAHNLINVCQGSWKHTLSRYPDTRPKSSNWSTCIVLEQWKIWNLYFQTISLSLYVILWVACNNLNALFGNSWLWQFYWKYGTTICLLRVYRSTTGQRSPVFFGTRKSLLKKPLELHL